MTLADVEALTVLHNQYHFTISLFCCSQIAAKEQTLKLVQRDIQSGLVYSQVKVSPQQADY